MAPVPGTDIDLQATKGELAETVSGRTTEATGEKSSSAPARPTVSVLINNYNYGRFVERAIDSVLAQQDAEPEIIVVDDGSSDDSHTVLQRYDKRIRLVFQENQGQAAAINAGVQLSHGDILCFLDADDWWAPNKLAAVTAAFQNNPALSLVYHRLQPMLIDDTPALKPIPRSLCSGDLRQRLVGSAGWWPFPLTSAVAVRRRYWDEAGIIPAQFRISADSWLTGIYPFLGEVEALPEPLGFYRIHDNTWYRPSDDASMLRVRIAHWNATVDAINRFMSSHDMSERLSLDDHHPYHVARARLTGATIHDRVRLAFKALWFAGEPNLLRRMRDALRLVRELPFPGQTDCARESCG